MFYCVVLVSVTRLGNFLHFGQPFKAGATIILPKLPAFLGNFCNGVKIIHFSIEIILGNLFRDFYLVTLVIFYSVSLGRRYFLVRLCKCRTKVVCYCTIYYLPTYDATKTRQLVKVGR